MTRHRPGRPESRTEAALREYDLDTRLFFDGNLKAFPLYEALDALLLAAFPDAGKRVQKTQITYYHRHVFACVSFARVRGRAALPDPYLVLTLGLPYPLASDRVAVKTEPYPGRWTTYLVLGSQSELDEEPLSWLRETYAFSESK